MKDGTFFAGQAFNLHGIEPLYPDEYRQTSLPKQKEKG